MLNEDYRDILHALSDEKVRFLLVGAYALAAHGYLRATMDIDIWEGCGTLLTGCGTLLTDWNNVPSHLGTTQVLDG
jgi:hypothetical protein